MQVKVSETELPAFHGVKYLRILAREDELVLVVLQCTNTYWNHWQYPRLSKKLL
jgi:hypothetical protein